jgi:hypothetical protein
VEIRGAVKTSWPLPLASLTDLVLAPTLGALATWVDRNYSPGVKLGGKQETFMGLAAKAISLACTDNNPETGALV